jgi:hypothetical protein
MGVWDDGDVVWIIACPCASGLIDSGSEFESVGRGLQDERSRERSYSFV